MLPASMQLNESVLTFSTPKAEKDLVIVRPRQLKVTCSTHLNSGHDTETASQMMTVIESSGGISGVRVTVSGPQHAAKSTLVKWEGVSFINNIAYTKEGLHVWRAYGIGSGKFVPWSNFKLGVFLR